MCPITDIAFEVSASERELYDFVEVDGLRGEPNLFGTDYSDATYDGLPE